MKIEKLHLKTIEEIEVKNLPKAVDVKKKLHIEFKEDDLSLQVTDVIELDLAYNNGWDRKANLFTRDAKKKYIDADKQYYKLTKTNMTIHSGTRDVYKQAKLYINYNYHGQGNPASWPGCSYHNWGLAADMIRKNENELVRSMNSAGWSQTKLPREPWHFECTASSDYGKVQKTIREFRKERTGLAYKWSEQVALFYQKVKDYNKRAPIFNTRLEKHKTNAQQLQAEINSFNSDVQRLKNRINQFNSDVRKYNRELQKAKDLYDEIMDMPSGPERNRKIRQYNQLVSWLENEQNRLNGESASINNENNRIEKWSNSLNVKIANFKREDNWLSLEYKALTKLESDIEKHKKNVTDLLSQIEKAIGI